MEWAQHEPKFISLKSVHAGKQSEPWEGFFSYGDDQHALRRINCCFISLSYIGNYFVLLLEMKFRLSLVPLSAMKVLPVDFCVKCVEYILQFLLSPLSSSHVSTIIKNREINTSTCAILLKINKQTHTHTKMLTSAKNNCIWHRKKSSWRWVPPSWPI